MKVKVHIHANFLCIFPERFSWKFAFDKQLHKYHVTKYFFFFLLKMQILMCEKNWKNLPWTASDWIFIYFNFVCVLTFDFDMHTKSWMLIRPHKPLENRAIVPIQTFSIKVLLVYGQLYSTESFIFALWVLWVGWMFSLQLWDRPGFGERSHIAESISTPA